jgi:hypothetical protein
MTLDLNSCYASDVALSFDFKKRRLSVGLINITLINPNKAENAIRVIKPLEYQAGIIIYNENQKGDDITLHINNGIDPVKLLDYLILKLNSLSCSTSVYDETEQ